MTMYTSGMNVVLFYLYILIMEGLHVILIRLS